MLRLRSASKSLPRFRLPATRSLPLRRFSTEATSSRRFRTLETVAFVGGTALIAYGLYETYFKPSTWPQEVHSDLHEAIKAKQAGDLVTARSYFERAWLTSRTLDPSVFSPLPFLKISGIGLALCDTLDPESAYQALEQIHTYLSSTSVRDVLSPLEKMRHIAVLNKLGEMSSELGRPLQEQETHLVAAVNELLHLVKAESEGQDSWEGIDESQINETMGMLTELDLPSWMDKEHFGAPFEALGEFYSRIGKVDYALPLYLQAISILIPPPPHQPRSETDICRGAQLMSNISELLIRTDKSPERLGQAALWASRAVAKIQALPPGVDDEFCSNALIVSLFNHGTILEYQGEVDRAQEMYEKSLAKAEQVGMSAGVQEAQGALQRLENGQVLSASQHASHTRTKDASWGSFFRGVSGR